MHVGYVALREFVTTGTPSTTVGGGRRNPFGTPQDAPWFRYTDALQQAPANGDYFYILTYVNDPGAAGYVMTSNQSVPNLASGTSGNLLWWLWGRTASSEPSAHTFAISPNPNLVDGAGAVGISCSGVGTAVVGTVGTASGTTCTAPGITMPADGFLFGMWAGMGGSNVKWSQPGDMPGPATGGVDFENSGIVNGVNCPGFSIGLDTTASAGATGNKSATQSSGGGDNIGILIGFV